MLRCAPDPDVLTTGFSASIISIHRCHLAARFDSGRAFTRGILLGIIDEDFAAAQYISTQPWIDATVFAVLIVVLLVAGRHCPARA